MGERDIPSPLPYHILDLEIYFFEFKIFDLVSSSKLLDHELRVCSELYLCSPEFDSASDTERCCGIFGDIIGRVTDIFMSLLYCLSTYIRDPDSTATRSWIASGTSV